MNIIIETAPKTQTQEQGSKIVDPSLQEIVALGIHKESRIALHLLECYSLTRASVFIYPSKFNLSPENIENLSPGFRNVTRHKIMRSFKDTTMEDLSRQFRRYLGLISIIYSLYSLGKDQIIEHAYSPKSEEYIRKVIECLGK